MKLPTCRLACTLFVLAVTISVLSAFSHTNGDAQLCASSRLVRQISRPVRASNAAMNDWVVLSLTR